MKKLLATMLILVLSTPLLVISTEKDYQASNQAQYQISHSVASKANYFDSVPSNPNLFEAVNSFSDPNLRVKAKVIKPDTAFVIKKLLVNDNLVPVFLLADGSYIEASRSLVYEDILLSQEKISQTYWLEPGFTVYQNPYTNGIKTIKTKLSSFTAVKLSKKAVTPHGTYYFINQQGWVEEKYLSSRDNRIKKVQELLTKKYNKANLSIFVKPLDGDESASINADKIMYSASVAKLPILYYVEQEIAKGKVELSDKLTYTDEVNNFDGAYKTEGSGQMPKKADNKSYTVEELLKAVAQHSDNVASNMLGYYIAHQYDQAYHAAISKVDQTDWNMKDRKVSAKTAAAMMEALYHQESPVLSYLSATEFDSERISKDIAVPVAHKIGDAYDYKHDVAVVYADQPFILSIFTDKSSYDEISNIADDIYGILK